MSFLFIRGSSANVSTPVRFAALLLVLTCLYILPGCQSDTRKKKQEPDWVRSKVFSEFGMLNADLHQRYILKFTTDATRAKPPDTVFINIDTLKTYLKNIPTDEAAVLIRLVVAHEVMHLFQHRNPLTYNNGQPYRVRMLEAQADILAARYTVLKIQQQDTMTTDGKELIEKYNEKKFINAYKLFFKLGFPIGSRVEHPSQFERASCIYRGVRCAITEIATAKLKKYISITGNGTQIKLLDSVVRIQRESLDIHDDYDPFNWSWEQAQLICHGDPVYLTNFIRMFSNTEPLKNKHGQVRGIALYQYFANDGYEDIDITVEFRAAHVRGTPNSFFENIEFEQAKYHRYHLQPFHTITTADPFKVPSGKGDWEVIVPPDTSSLYYVVPSRKVKPEAQKKFDAMSLKSTNLEFSHFADYIDRLNKAIKKKNISDIIASGGMPSGVGTDYNSLYFTGIVPINENFSNIVSYDGRLWGQYQVKLLFKETNDSLLALKEFERWSDRLSRAIDKQNGPLKNVSPILFQPQIIRSAAFKSEAYPGNLNYLYLVRKELVEEQFPPFTRIKGGRFAGSPESYNFNVYLIIRQPPNLSLSRPWPRTFQYYPIYADD